MKLPKELKEREKKKVMKIKKKQFKQPIEVKESEELLMKAFWFHCLIKKIPITDLEINFKFFTLFF